MFHVIISVWLVATHVLGVAGELKFQVTPIVNEGTFDYFVSRPRNPFGILPGYESVMDGFQPFSMDLVHLKPRKNINKVHVLPENCREDNDNSMVHEGCHIDVSQWTLNSIRFHEDSQKFRRNQGRSQRSMLAFARTCPPTEFPILELHVEH